MVETALASTPTLATSRAIPLTRLVASGANVRRIKSDISVDELAADIARRGLLQSILVRPVLDDAGAETGDYAVFAGGRRLVALRKLVEGGHLPADVLVPCMIKAEGIETEDSLAENVMRAGLHPLDQYRAFKALSDEEGLSVEEIAARFFVSPQVVRQRLKLASASLVLLAEYAEDGMTLEQLMAFCVTDDHIRQEAVWEQIRHGYNKEPYTIRRLLTEGAVKGNDRRVLFVGREAYEAAGGVILRDLFTNDGGGWFQDAALLDRLAAEKLQMEAQAILAEGWKWIEVAPSFPYGHLNGLTRLSSSPVPVTAEEQARYDKALAEYSALSEEYEEVEELPEEIDQRMGELEREMADIDERSALFDPSETGHAGVFVSIEHDGGLRLEAGYVRAEDRAALMASAAGGLVVSSGGSETGDTAGSSSPDCEEVEIESATRLSDRLTSELTAYRTLALREKLADDPDTALLAATHVLALKAFYRFASSDTCLEIDLRSTGLATTAPDIGETALATGMDARQARWATLLPKSPGDLWEALVGFDADSLASLFAFCVATSINALHLPHIRRSRELGHADALSAHLGLDMRRHWQPTAKTFFNKVTKAEILATIREIKGEATAQMIDHLKKADMALEAERLAAGSGWLPSPLRASDTEAGTGHAISDRVPSFHQATVEPESSEGEVTALPAFLAAAASGFAAHSVAAE